ncbi:hypothetical protein ACFV0C_07690 [Streptomyces sp. NPDC059568]|uniref:hypothetical protein n=1 Tax=Streptomyces sp. NPDC059568 TaxID=3346868 RepID=UPI0036813250
MNPSPSLGQRLSHARERGFVGRAQKLDVFRSALDGEPDSFAVLFVHGPGGIGKSSLLRRFAGLARSAGRTLIRIDGRSLGLSPESFEAEAAPAFDDERSVLLIDTFEQCQGLETWLRENFLPRLPAEALVVIAGRQPPGLPWQADAFWLDRAPDGFHVHHSRDTGGPVGFMAWLRLTEPADGQGTEETAMDPVVAVARHHVRAAGPLRAGEHIALGRFMIYPPAYQRPW